MARHGGQTEHGFVFRPGTNDEAVFHHLVHGREYELPDSFRAQDIVIDVGMHIGSFCYLALALGSHQVHGFEADQANYECAERNLKSFGNRVQLYNKAVWRSDRAGDALFFHPSNNEANRGGGNVLWANRGQEVSGIALDHVLQELTRGGKKRVRLLKIDCEGAEFPILLTSRSIHLIDEITGEYHEYGGENLECPIPEHARVPGYAKFSMAELAETLHDAGFEVTSEHRNANLGLFHAVHRSSRKRIPGFLRTGVWSAWQTISKRRTGS